MALSKEIEIEDSGIVASYHSIDSVHFYRDLNSNEYSVSIKYSSFKDQQARTDGKKPISVNAIMLDGSAFIDAVASLGYAELKQLEKFTGATDV